MNVATLKEGETNKLSSRSVSTTLCVDNIVQIF